MKKVLKHLMIIAIACFFTMPGYAQNTTSAKKTSSGSALSADRNKMLCKSWQLDTLSEYGVDNKADGKNAHDVIILGSDGSFSMIQNGTNMSGTWSYSGGHINAEIVSPGKDKLSFAIISFSDSRLVLAYQFPAPDLSKVQYTYSPKKQN